MGAAGEGADRSSWGDCCICCDSDLQFLRPTSKTVENCVFTYNFVAQWPESFFREFDEYNFSLSAEGIRRAFCVFRHLGAAIKHF